MSQRHRVLVVDDNPRNLLILQKVLGPTYDIATAASGEESLVVADAVRPDLILLDINMPGMDGYETCRQLRANPRIGRPKIIIVSAHGMLKERLDGYAVGADDYVTKPFNQDELLAKVRVYLELKSVQEVDQLRRNLISLLRHETQTPLTAILAAVEILKSSALGPGEGNRFLKIISEASERLSTLIDRAVFLSSLRSRELGIMPSAVPLSVVIEHARASRAELAASRKVTLRTEHREDPVLELDPRFAEHVLGALLEDAITACPSGGNVSLATQLAGTWATLRIQDDGGYRGERFSRTAFEPFAVTDVDHHHRGDGLALAIAREMILVHGGIIEVESHDTGTTFSVLLPLAGESIGEDAAGARQVPESAGEPEAPAA